LPTETKKKANKTKQQSHNPNPRQDVLGQKTWCFLRLPEASEKRLTPFVSSPSTLRSAFCLSIIFSSLEGRKGEEALASREGEKYAIDGGAIEGNGAIAASAATSDRRRKSRNKEEETRPGFQLCCSCWWFTEPLEN